ncbi:UMP kinase [Desulfurivibrio alkaliphilus]|uniref:Uridylate kinase n=1 Tax=Desulfurivibrio alkaliphilus (strain DSM 19089 / UNIQEM U267 / AHT2) TaxID=589865 RepID=D6Z297_DESAT|nr:UMP kinase [Desulfurivibrio alkaliphilus]ADH85672.1 uridylate kinase [Desulfurivibrio alkaliphilus AHT 2]
MNEPTTAHNRQPTGEGSQGCRRVLLKLSGEALMGDQSHGIKPEVLDYLAGEIRAVTAAGVETGLVVGAGNIFRGMAGSASGMDRSTADNMGMLATVINALALHDALERHGVAARVLSALAMPTVCEPFSRQKAFHHLAKGRVVIFAAGTGNPYFTTDTAAMLRALEIRADLVCKATRVDGVYDQDPLRNPNAVRFDHLSFQEVLSRQLKVMDSAAISLAMDNAMPIMVFDMMVAGNMRQAVSGKQVGTLIS